jgi:hypothetical protein
MHALLFALALLGQTSAPSQVRLDSNALDRYTDAMEQQNDQVARVVAEARDQAYQEHQFIARFNELIAALTRFSEKYKKQHVIDVKAVKSVRKAYENLERSDAWFKTAK